MQEISITEKGATEKHKLIEEIFRKKFLNQRIIGFMSEIKMF